MLCCDVGGVICCLHCSDAHALASINSNIFFLNYDERLSFVDHHDSSTNLNENAESLPLILSSTERGSSTSQALQVLEASPLDPSNFLHVSTNADFDSQHPLANRVLTWNTCSNFSDFCANIGCICPSVIEAPLLLNNIHSLHNREPINLNVNVEALVEPRGAPMGCKH